MVSRLFSYEQARNESEWALEAVRDARARMSEAKARGDWLEHSKADLVQAHAMFDFFQASRRRRIAESVLRESIDN